MADKAPGIGASLAAALPSAYDKGVAYGTDVALSKVKQSQRGVVTNGIDLIFNRDQGKRDAAGGNLISGLTDLGVSAGLDKLKKKNPKAFKIISKLFGGGGKDSKASGEFQRMLARADPQMQFEFNVLLPAIQGFAGSVGAAALPDEYVEDVDLPVDFIDAGTSFYVNARRVNLPGMIQAPELVLRFYAEHRLVVERYLNAWRNSTVSPKGLYNIPYGPTGFMKSVKVQLRASQAVIFEGEIYGCFPTTRGLIQLQSNTSERVVLEQTFNAHGMIPNFDPQSSSAASQGKSPMSIGQRISTAAVGAIKRKL